MKLGRFILRFDEYYENVELFSCLKNTDVFINIVDRILIGRIYDNVFPGLDTIDDIESLLMLVVGCQRFEAIAAADRRKKFATFLVNTIPTIGNDGYSPYMHMPID